MAELGLLFMQVWGGFFYLLNKIFLSRKERTRGSESQRWRILSWRVYIVGQPAWIIILGYESNWMVTLVEVGGLPSMVLGLMLAKRYADAELSEEDRRRERRLDLFARWAAILGIGISIYHLGLMERLTQWVELGVTVGFLVGTYRLTNDHLDGYKWFFLMNVSAGFLMYLQGYNFLVVQQGLSLGFVIDAYLCKKAVLKKRETKRSPADCSPSEEDEVPTPAFMEDMGRPI